MHFYFLNGGLQQVTLSRTGTFHFDSAKLTFESLTEALRSKYGQEVTRDVKTGVLRTLTATWVQGRTNISLLALGVRDNPAIVNVVYQARVAQEADKL